MKTLEEIEQILEAHKDYLAAEYGVVKIGVFGSYARGEQRQDSDVDILIELERPPRITLIGLVELENYLSELLGIKVDVAIRKTQESASAGGYSVRSYRYDSRVPRRLSGLAPPMPT